MNRDPLDELADELFSAARDERPDPALVERITALTADDAARPLGAAPVRPLEAPAPHGARALKNLRPRRFVAIALAAIVAGLALFIALPRDEGAPITLSPERRESPPPSAPPAPVQDEPPHAVEPALAPAEPASSPASPAAPRRPKTAPPAPTSGEGTRSGDGAAAVVPARVPLAEQLRQLKEARAAVRSGEGNKALALLDRYEVESSGSDLSAEAALLRMDALVSVGREAEAAALARRFVDENPDSPHADRARSFIE